MEKCQCYQNQGVLSDEPLQRIKKKINKQKWKEEFTVFSSKTQVDVCYRVVSSD